MLKKFASVAVHLVFFALVMAIAAYWAVKIFTPAPTAAPPPLPPPPVRDPDPVAAARMFGKVERLQAVTSNIQAIGAFAAGKDSSAVLIVDGRPARVFLIGQDVAPGLKLVSVTAETVVLEAGGVRQEIRLPPRAAVAAFGGPPPPANFSREGNTLSAPSAGGAAARPNLPGGPMAAPPPRAVPPPQVVTPQPAPAQPVPQEAPPSGTAPGQSQ